MKFCIPESSVLLLLLLFACVATNFPKVSGQSSVTCKNRPSPCFRKMIRCPVECTLSKPSDPKAKACFLDCNSPLCETTCRSRRPNCNNLGTGCYDPRFIGGDGVVFYFHGRSNEHFNLVSDPNIQVNARFIGLRPPGRVRDFIWINALGIMSNSHSLAIEVARASHWDEAVEHLQLSYDGNSLAAPEGHRAEWRSPQKKLTIERTASRNNIAVTVENKAEILISVVPVSEDDARIHMYQIPDNDCYVHLEVQFRFFGLSQQIEGVLGRTNRPDFKNTAKMGVAMPVVG